MKAQEYGYDQSMMARFYKLLEDNVEHNMIGRLPILQLTVQYRMHPDICLFPSNYVYNRSLKTHRQTETSRCSSDWPFQPYLVFDVGDGSERRDNEYVLLSSIPRDGPRVVIFVHIYMGNIFHTSLCLVPGHRHFSGARLLAFPLLS